MYHTYIIESERNGLWYYGHSENTDRRLEEHNQNKNKSSKNRGPWKLILKRSFETKLEANRFELKLKKLKNKRYLMQEFKEFFIGA